MQLIHSPASPFVRKVNVVLHETGQVADVELLNVATSPVKTDARARSANPSGKIPALLRDDGPAIYDSRVICRFLNARAKGSLYPEARQWEVLTLEATAEAIMDAAVLVTYEGRLRPADKQFDGWIDAQWSKVENCLAAVNNRWMSHLHGRLDIAHIGMGCALGYLDFRHDARNWRKGNDALAAWYETFAKRDSMVATQPQG